MVVRPALHHHQPPPPIVVVVVVMVVVVVGVVMAAAVAASDRLVPRLCRLPLHAGFVPALMTQACAHSGRLCRHQCAGHVVVLTFSALWQRTPRPQLVLL